MHHHITTITQRRDILSQRLTHPPRRCPNPKDLQEGKNGTPGTQDPVQEAATQAQAEAPATAGAPVGTGTGDGAQAGAKAEPGTGGDKAKSTAHHRLTSRPKSRTLKRSFDCYGRRRPNRRTRSLPDHATPGDPHAETAGTMNDPGGNPPQRHATPGNTAKMTNNPGREDARTTTKRTTHAHSPCQTTHGDQDVPTVQAATTITMTRDQDATAALTNNQTLTPTSLKRILDPRSRQWTPG